MIFTGYKCFALCLVFTQSLLFSNNTPKNIILFVEKLYAVHSDNSSKDYVTTDESEKIIMKSKALSLS